MTKNPNATETYRSAQFYKRFIAYVAAKGGHEPDASKDEMRFVRVGSQGADVEVEGAVSASSGTDDTGPARGSVT